MNKFSLSKYNSLPKSLKSDFDISLAQQLSLILKDIKNDDVLGCLSVEKFVAVNGNLSDSSLIVSELYSKISSGIQAGSGNQNLFNGVLHAFVESWNVFNKTNLK